MSENKFFKRIIYYFFVLVILSGDFLLNIQTVHASSVTTLPPVKTNNNLITTEFRDHIRDKEAFDIEVEKGRIYGAEKAKTPDQAEFLSEEEIRKLDSEKERLGAIRDTDLETEGRKVRNNKENAYFQDFETDYTKPGAIAHKKDVEEIVSATERKIGELTTFLRANGIDCKSVAKSSEVKDPYYIEIEREETKEVEYDSKFCEFLMNSYQCAEKLIMGCSDLKLIPGKLTNVRGNMVHTIDMSGNLIIGVNQEKYFFNDWGAQQDYEFSFEVDNTDGIETFRLLQVNWADYVLITLNGNIIFAEPGLNGKLEMSTDPRNYRRNKAMYFGVDIGRGYYVPANTKMYHNRSPNYEVKQFLKNGLNKLKIRLVYAGGGKIHAHLQYRERKCDSWVERWEETCIHRK